MDFAELITAKNNEELIDQAQALTEESARKAEIVAVRKQIVHDKIADFATSHNMDHIQLESIRPNLFMVGGFIFSVDLHTQVDKSKREVTDRHKVLLQHRVRLVGYDITESITEITVGTLALLDTESVRKAHNTASDRYVFGAEGVISILSSRASNR